MAVVVVALVLVVASVVAAALTMSERQFHRSDEQPTPAPSEEPGSPVPGAIASAVDRAGRVRLHNSTEARAIGALRRAHQLAMDGDFQRRVRVVLDGLRSEGGDGRARVAALHDRHRPGGSGPPVAHLAVGPAGVFVIESVVRSTKVTVGSEELLLGRGRRQQRDPVIDHVLRRQAAVLTAVGSVPVHGVVVFQDLLSLPGSIRQGTATLRGVHLVTLDRLRELVAAPGPVDDPGAVAAALARVFEPALASTHTGRMELTGGEGLPPPA